MAIFGKNWTLRYAWHKIVQSVEAGAVEARHVAPIVRRDRDQKDFYTTVKNLVQERVIETFSAPLIKVIKFTGPAMSPLLNRSGAKDHTSFEYLLTHKLIEPSPRNVLIGDVVCFKHPLRGVEPSALLVRRVVACGGGILESEDEHHRLAPDTVWVTADNPDLEPPNVEDSRTFGPLQLSNVVGRCIYAVRSNTDREHIVNNPRWREIDRDVVAVELTPNLLKALDEEKA